MSWIIKCADREAWIKKDIVNGQRFELVGNANLATKYSTKQKAVNVTNCLPKLYQNTQFEFVEKVDEDKVTKVDVAKAKEIDEDLFSKRIMLEEMQVNFTAIRKEKKVLEKELIDIEQLQLDILHKFENEDKMNMYQSWLVGKLLTKTRKRRRQVKNNLEIINQILDADINTLAKPTIFNRVCELFSCTEDSKYRPRVYRPLFKKDWVENIRKVVS